LHPPYFEHDAFTHHALHVLDASDSNGFSANQGDVVANSRPKVDVDFKDNAEPSKKVMTTMMKMMTSQLRC